LQPSNNNKHKFSKKQVKEFQDVFNTFDMDKDGSISLEEVRGIMKRLGRTPDEAKLTEMFHNADLDGRTASLVLNEFLFLSWQATVKSISKSSSCLWSTE
jgi:Ca2+-binding EF-hand superfamily protein